LRRHALFGLSLVAYYGAALATVVLAQRARYHWLETGPWPTVLAALALGLAEYRVSTWLDAPLRVRSASERVRARVFMGLRIALWLAMLWLGVEYPATRALTDDRFFAYTLAPRLPAMAYGALWISPWITGLGALAWVGLVTYSAMRRGRFRVAAFLGLPVAVVALQGVAYYGIDSRGGLSEAVKAQEAVRVVFEPHDLAESTDALAWQCPRALDRDPWSHDLYAAFGCTLRGTASRHAYVQRITPGTRAAAGFDTFQTRVLLASNDPDYLYFVPWKERRLFRLDKSTLSDVRTFPIPALENDLFVEPTDSVAADPFLYLALAFQPSVQKIDTRSGEVVDSLDLWVGNLVPFGTQCCNLTTLAATGELILVTAGDPDGRLVARVDTHTMDVIAARALPSVPWKIAVQPRPPYAVYISNEYDSHLWRVDHDTLEIRDTWSATPATRVYYDRFRDRLVLVDPYRGTLRLATPDNVEVATYQVGTRPSAAYVAEEGIFVLSSDGIIEIRPTEGEPSPPATRDHP